MKAIINGKIKTMTGTDYENGTILIDGSKIADIGENIAVPEDAEVIDAAGRLVLPGFIDAHSHIGMWEECIGFEGADGNECTDPVTPNINAIDGVYPLDPPFEEAMKSGVTSVVTGPGSTNVIGGQFIAMKTVGHCADDMTFKNPVAMKCAFGENPKNYHYNNRKAAPMTRMGIAAILREALSSARDYMQRKEMADGDILKCPAYNAKYEALIPVLRGELSLKVHAHRSDDILTAIRIAKEFGIKATLDHCTDGHLIVDEIKRSGFDAIIGPSFGFKSKLELKNKSFETAAILSKAGIKVAIMTDHPVFSESDLPMFAGLAVKVGMDREEALKAISINAAEITGIADRVGSLEKGKDADIVIWETDPLSLDFETYCTIVEGEITHHK